MTFSIMTLSIMTFNITTVSKMTISTMTLVPECFKAECRLIWMPFTLSVTDRLLMLSVIMLNVIMLSVFKLNVVVPNNQLRLFDLSFQTNAWNTVDIADIEYLICHNGKWAGEPFKNFTYYMVLKVEHCISKTGPFDPSSPTNCKQNSD
jgi:hypothetical protein